MRLELPDAYHEGLNAFPDGTRPYNWADGAPYHWWMCGWFDAQERIDDDE